MQLVKTEDIDHVIVFPKMKTLVRAVNHFHLCLMKKQHVLVKKMKIV